MSSPSAEEFGARAQAAENAGDPQRAETILADALQTYPGEAALWNAAGNFSMRRKHYADAAQRFGRAADIRPAAIDYTINTAIALNAAGRHLAALERLRACENAGRGDVRYCSTRATAARGALHLGEAAKWYDMAIAHQPRHARALHGRARVALERGEATALQRFDRAISANPGDADLWLGKAQSLDVEGRSDEAMQIAEQIVAQAPAWIEGLAFLSQLKLAAGEADATAPYRMAAERVPNDPSIPADHCARLAGLDKPSQAADVAANARARFPNMPYFAFLEAVHAGSAGDDERAEAIFAALALDTPERKLHEARHRIRRGETERAEQLLALALSQEPMNISAWALRGIVWRMCDDPRAEWLHEQAGLVQLLPLRDAARVLPPAIETLHRLHDASLFPLGQSLRGGTQTRGRLFDRMEPELLELHSAIEETLGDYRAALPALDPQHPLLRHRETPWRISGSWSVRLAGGGDYHTAHIHPQGIVSSALYLELPEETVGPDTAEARRGWLELGRPPPDLRIDLPPLRVIRPECGHLALFPSTLYHGTTPFSDARRMSVAFDVTTIDGGVA